MNEYVKQSIDNRRIAFTNSYELTEEFQKKVDNLFKKIMEFGQGCSDAMDFETKFMASYLNTEYNELFTEIATNCKPIIKEATFDSSIKSDKEKLADEVLSEAKYIANDITMPARRKAREELDKKLRDTPLGKIEQASNTINIFKRIFKK